MKSFKCFLLMFAALGLAACDSTDFESTWQDPSTRTLDLRTEAVAGFLLSSNESVRRSFEANLANELNKRGIEATPGYELVPTDVTDKDETLEDLQGSRMDHAIFMRVVDREKEISYVPGTAWYPGPFYDPFYAGFGGPWSSFYEPGYYVVDTVVSVETLVYSVPDSKLLWAGLSKTMNPSEVDDFVEDLVSAAVHEMNKTGLVKKES